MRYSDDNGRGFMYSLACLAACILACGLLGLLANVALRAVGYL